MIYFESSVMRHSDKCQSFSPPRSRTIEIIFSVIKITKVEYLFLSGNPVQLWDQSKMFAIINKILDWFKSLFWKEGEEELANRENICLINNFNKLFWFQRWSWPLWDCSIQVRSLRLLWSSGEFLICSLLRRQNNFRQCYRCKLLTTKLRLFSAKQSARHLRKYLRTKFWLSRTIKSKIHSPDEYQHLFCWSNFLCLSTECESSSNKDCENQSWFT